MKHSRYPFAIIILILTTFISCKKDSPIREVEFKSTTYDSLGTYDSKGLPNYLFTPSDVISGSLAAFIDSVLPEQVNIGIAQPELLTNTAIADIKITQTSDVYITFIAQGTMYKNTFAFYTYPTGSSPATTEDINTITYVFPNAGDSTTLQKGDKVKIGRFNAGTSIGFVLLRDAWNSTTRSINKKAPHLCSNDILNPEVDATLRKHCVLINFAEEDKTIIGFEDVYRTDPNCDNDFNDLVIYCTVTPIIS